MYRLEGELAKPFGQIKGLKAQVSHRSGDGRFDRLSSGKADQ
jgi:hypothetical protein